MNTEEYGQIESPAKLRPKWDIFLRILFGSLLLVSLVTGYASRPRLNSSMRRMLRGSHIMEVERKEPPFQIPFLPDVRRVFTVSHSVDLASRMQPLVMRSYFSPEGNYLGSHSFRIPANTVLDVISDAESELQPYGHTFEPPPQLYTYFSLQELLNRLNDFIGNASVNGFVAFPFVWDDNVNQPQPVMLILIWCHSEMPTPTSESGHTCNGYERLVYALESDEILALDELL